MKSSARTPHTATRIVRERSEVLTKALAHLFAFCKVTEGGFTVNTKSAKMIVILYSLGSLRACPRLAHKVSVAHLRVAITHDF